MPPSSKCLLSTRGRWYFLHSHTAGSQLQAFTNTGINTDIMGLCISYSMYVAIGLYITDHLRCINYEFERPGNRMKWNNNRTVTENGTM